MNTKPCNLKHTKLLVCVLKKMLCHHLQSLYISFRYASFAFNSSILTITTIPPSSPPPKPPPLPPPPRCGQVLAALVLSQTHIVFGVLIAYGSLFVSSSETGEHRHWSTQHVAWVLSAPSLGSAVGNWGGSRGGGGVAPVGNEL